MRSPSVSVSKVLESYESLMIQGRQLPDSWRTAAMWTNENRARYNRDHLRYPSDVTDEEWAHVAPLIPKAKRGGRKREVSMREVFNGIMYMLSTGCSATGIPCSKCT